MEVLVGGIIPVVTEKHEFDTRNKSLIKPFSKFLTVGIMMEGSQNMGFHLNHPQQKPGFQLGH